MNKNMTQIYDKDTPSTDLIEDITKKIDALGREPRFIIEIDKASYVPGLKDRFEVWDRIRSSSITFNQLDDAPLTSIKTEEPGTVVSGGESGDRFEYIKCTFAKWCSVYALPKQAFYFLLAVAKHETGFGTLGQGRPEKGSFIVGYGCPGACDQTYSGIDTQAKYACKRYAEAMKSRLGAIKSRGYMNASDIDYFHQGGDKGYNRWVWSADGANWKSRVKTYYDVIRLGGSKWECKEGTSQVSASMEKENEEDCGCDDYVYEDIQGTQLLSAGDVELGSVTFPIEGEDFNNGAYVSSHHMAHKGGRAGHRGIDIVSKTGINGKWVVAAFDGYVNRAYRSTSYGNVVFIKHSNGYETVYAHMQENSLQVKSGQNVKAGDRLGRAGSTGNSSGPHLHFEVWKGGWVYHGSGHLDPYWILTGAQKIGVGDNAPQNPKMTVKTNLKFNKCFDKNAKLDANWIGKENVKHFTSTVTGEKYIGFSSNVKKGQVKDFGYRHNFSADGWYEYAFFCQLKSGDSVTVTYDGIVVKRYTSKNNTSKPTYEKPIYTKMTNNGTEGENSHILDFTIENVSGQAEFGIKCFKVAEVDVQHGYTNVNVTSRLKKRDVWIETGAFVYDKTFTIEKDVMNCEVSSHFDMRTATAKFTLDNSKGVYSPTYQQNTIFPDNKHAAEMTYLEGSDLQHVLSEGAMVRIYGGYGDEMVRVFTGRIKGEIEQDSEARTVSINCVDMYDDLEEYVFDRMLTFPRRDEIHGDETHSTLWVKSAIVHNIVNEAGLFGWRQHEDDLKYPDAQIEETYYIDIDRGGKKAVVWDPKKKQYIEKKIATVRDAYGFKNPYVQAIDFNEGTRAADAIQEVIGDLMFRSYCDRYGTYRLENMRNLTAVEPKWDFIDNENIKTLSTSIDHSRVRNHLLVVGSGLQIEHFVDKELFIATKGRWRTAKIVLDWIDESFGATAKGIKTDVAEKLFFDMKRQARTINTAVKGNPMIDILDGVYVYDRNTSSEGYFIVKGNRLVFNKEGMFNFLELTWMDKETYEKEVFDYSIPAETSPENVEGEVECGAIVNSGQKKASFTHKVTKSGYVYVSWDMYGQGDKMSIYVGGKLRWTTNKIVSNKGSIGFYYRKSEGKIEVKLNEGIDMTYNTYWKYTLYCPGTAPANLVKNTTLV